MGGETENPKRNIPLSLIIGMFSILGIYAVANIAYFYALPMSEILNSDSELYPDALPVATKSALTFMGDYGVIILSCAFVFSALGTLNESVLTSARFPYVMAKDGLFLNNSLM